MAVSTHRQDRFLDRDLADIERGFLPPGSRITDLPVHLDDRVPASAVGLDRTVDVDAAVETLLTTCQKADISPPQSLRQGGLVLLAVAIALAGITLGVAVIALA